MAKLNELSTKELRAIRRKVEAEIVYNINRLNGNEGYRIKGQVRRMLNRKYPVVTALSEEIKKRSIKKNA